MVSVRIHNNVCYLDGRLSSSDYQEFKKILGYMPEDSFWMVKKHNEKLEEQENVEEWRKEWDGSISTVCWNKQFCKCNVKKSGLHFPTGLLGNAVKFFQEKSIAYNIKDERLHVEKNIEYSLSDEFEFRDYQKEAKDKILMTDRGIIKCATGGGKTAIALSVIAERGVIPAIFYVPSQDLLKQTKTEMERFLRHNGVPLKVGIIGGGYKEFGDITVMTIQTAVRSLGGVWKKYDEEDTLKDKTDISDIKNDIKDLIRSSKLITCDEVQHWASETCRIISDGSEMAKYKYGYSATPFRDKGDDILIDGCFGKCVVDISASFLIERDWLVPPDIYFITIKNMLNIKKRSYPEIYKHAIVQNDVRNEVISNMATGLLNSDRKNILILCRKIDHGKTLESMIDGSVFLHGSHTGKVREKHLDKMRAGETSVTIASTIFDEGIDVRSLDGLILAGSGKSSTRALQRIGRTLRPFPGKEKAIIIDFMDMCKYLEDHSFARRNIYRTEPKFNVSTVDLEDISKIKTRDMR
jgi:superfamily II DNA or RNA helicase